MTPTPSSSPQSSSPTEPNIPAWDTVGRWLERARQVNKNMRTFWSKLDAGRREWYSEVRGAFGHTIAFTYRRSHGRFGEWSEILELIREIHLLNRDTMKWEACRCNNRIDLYGRTQLGFAVCILTPFDSYEQLPTWVHVS